MAEAMAVQPGQVRALLTGRGGIALAAALEGIAGSETGGRLTHAPGWTEDDAAAIVAAAKRAERSQATRLRVAGVYAHAHARFLLVTRGHLAEFVGDPDLDPRACATAIYWNGWHRGEITRAIGGRGATDWDPSDREAAVGLVASLAESGGEAAGIALVLLRFLDTRGVDLSSMPEAFPPLLLTARWASAKDPRVSYSPSTGRRTSLGDTFGEVDDLIARGLTAPPGSPFRERAESVRFERCRRTPPPTAFSCDTPPPPGVPGSPIGRPYRTGFTWTQAWSTCEVPPVDPRRPVAIGREVFPESACTSLRFGQVGSEGERVKGAMLFGEGMAAEAVRLDDRVCLDRRRVVAIEPRRLVLAPIAGDAGNCWVGEYVAPSPWPVQWGRCEGLHGDVPPTGNAASDLACADLVLAKTQHSGVPEVVIATFVDRDHTSHEVGVGDVLCDGLRVRHVEARRVVLEPDAEGNNCFETD